MIVLTAVHISENTCLICSPCAVMKPTTPPRKVTMELNTVVTLVSIEVLFAPTLPAIAVHASVIMP